MLKFVDNRLKFVVCATGAQQVLVIRTDAAPGSGAERHVRVIMAAGRSFGQKVVRVEHVGVGEHLAVTVDFECGDDDGGTDRQGYVSGSWKAKLKKKI